MSYYTPPRLKCERTRTGLMIGCAYIPKPVQPSGDAEVMQALFGRPKFLGKRGSFVDRIKKCLTDWGR